MIELIYWLFLFVYKSMVFCCLSFGVVFCNFEMGVIILFDVKYVVRIELRYMRVYFVSFSFIGVG